MLTARRTKHWSVPVLKTAPSRLFMEISSSRPAGDQVMPVKLLEPGGVETSRTWSWSCCRNRESKSHSKLPLPVQGSVQVLWTTAPAVGPRKNNLLSLNKLWANSFNPLQVGWASFCSDFINLVSNFRSLKLLTLLWVPTSSTREFWRRGFSDRLCSFCWKFLKYLKYFKTVCGPGF